MLILRENLPFAEEQVLDYVADFLQSAHRAEERYTVRDGINMARFALKLVEAAVGELPARPVASSPLRIEDALETALAQTLGREALRYVQR